MYLTRMALDITNRKTLQALSSPSMFHGAVESALPGERRRNLWRIDQLNGQYYLLVLSEDKPDLTQTVKQFAKKNEAWVTKDYAPFLARIQDGTVWNFRLCANPTYSVVQENGKRGRVCAHSTREHQRIWLKNQGEKHGFSLNDDSFDVVHTQWYHFNKGNKKNRISMLAVTYEGILEVADAETFRKMLIEGLGREKAYGVGLMTLVHVERG